MVAGVKIVDGIFIYDNNKPKFQCKKYACDEDELMLRRLHENQWEVSLLKVQLKDAEQKLKALSDNYYDATSTTRILKADDDIFTYKGDEIEPQDLLALRRIDFECGMGEIIAVVGSVGSGKSTIINSLLGEVKLLS